MGTVSVGDSVYVSHMGSVSKIHPAEALAFVRELFAVDIDGRPVAQLGDDLRTLQQIRNVVDADFLRRLGVFDAHGGAAAEHSLSTQSWLRHNCRVSAAAAHGRLAIARRLSRDSESATDWRLATDRPAPLRDAMVNGVLSYDHAVTVTCALDKLPLAAQGPAEEILVASARTMDPGTLRRVADTIREAVAPELLLDGRAGCFRAAIPQRVGDARRVGCRQRTFRPGRRCPGAGCHQRPRDPDRS